MTPAVKRQIAGARRRPLDLPPFLKGAAKPSKYRNVKTVVDGITFASKREATRYGELKLLERRGEIEGLTLQHRFRLSVREHFICTYVADFYYCYKARREWRVEDVKGVKTAVYRLKRKLMKACYDIDIVEV